GRRGHRRSGRVHRLPPERRATRRAHRANRGGRGLTKRPRRASEAVLVRYTRWMRSLRYAFTGLLVLTLVSIRADTWPWPPAGGEARHSTGIVLLGPIDYDAIRNTEPFEGPLRKAWSDWFTLTQEVDPGLFGYPWADRKAGDLVVPVADPRGVELVQQWVRSGLQVPSPKRARPIHD